MTTTEFRDIAGTTLAREIATESGAYSHVYWRQALHQGVNITPDRMDKIVEYVSLKRELEDMRHKAMTEVLDSLEKQLSHL